MKQYATLSREEQYEQAVQKSTYLFSTEKRLGLTNNTDRGYLAESVIVPFISVIKLPIDLYKAKGGLTRYLLV